MFLNESMVENSRREDRVQDDDPLNHIRRGFVFLIKTNIAKQPDQTRAFRYVIGTRQMIIDAKSFGRRRRSY